LAIIKETILEIDGFMGLWSQEKTKIVPPFSPEARSGILELAPVLRMLVLITFLCGRFPFFL
jgi:hypothetical protein